MCCRITKLRLWITAIALVLSIGAAAEPSTEQVHTLLENYMSLFNEGDTVAMASTIYHAPIQYAGNRGTTFWQTEKDVADGLSSLIEDIREAGWSHSETDSIEVCFATEHLAFVFLRYSLIFQSDSPSPSVMASNVYVATDTAGDWRIIAAYDSDADSRLTC